MIYLLKNILLIIAVSFINPHIAFGYDSGIVKVNYQTIINGETVSRDGMTIVIAGKNSARIYNENEKLKLIPQIPEEVSYIDYSSEFTFQVASLYNGRKIYTEEAFSEYPLIESTGETEEILGYNCKKVKATLRSNSIELWYTTDLNVKGTPIMSYGIVDGLVLKVIRNGNYGYVATNVEKIKKKSAEPVIVNNKGERVDASYYKYLVTESLITTVSVFEEEQISWGDLNEQLSVLQSDVTNKYAGGTVIVKKVTLPVMKADYMVFAELTQYSNGDAYDRTGTVFVIPDDKQLSLLDALRNGIEVVPAFRAANDKDYHATIATSDFSPAIELIRFFTPFGIRKFNEQVNVYGQKWEDAAYFKQDITDLLPSLQGEVWIGVFIGNYDSGGHKVSLDLKYYPVNRVLEEDFKENEQWIYPLFNTLNIMEMAGQEYGTMFDGDSLNISFSVPEGIKNLTLRYISTGHGGWGGGDEFNQKMNEIFIDGKRVHSYIPWNSNCGAFRNYNPASGNFWNGVSSSDYSRSGWCPGEAVNPVYIPLPELNPGMHIMKIAIPIGKPSGGSFSHWNVSGVLLGER